MKGEGEKHHLFLSFFFLLIPSSECVCKHLSQRILGIHSCPLMKQTNAYMFINV